MEKLQNTRQIEYQPAGETLRQFHASHEFVRLLIGPLGSGKTSAAILEILWRAQEQAKAADGKRYSRWAIIRNSKPELLSTTLKSWEQWVPVTLGKYKQAPVMSHVIETNDLHIKVLSMELTGAWVDECREVSPQIIQALLGRVGRYPAKRDGGCSWHGLILTTNPPDSESWLYKMAELERPSNWTVFKQPSGLSPDAENLHNLPDNYYQNLLAANTADWAKVFVHGEYGFVQPGAPVFPMYRDSFHASEEKLTPMPQVLLQIGLDFGLQPAAVFGQRLPNGRWQIIDELIADDVGMQRFAQTLRTYIQTEYAGFSVELWGDPAGSHRSQTDERSAMEVLQSVLVNVRCQPAPSNNLTERLESVKSVLNRAVDGESGLIISPRCGHLRKAMSGGYHYKTVRSANGARTLATPEKNAYSHVSDALQYLLGGGGEFQNVLGNQQRGWITPRNNLYVSEYDELNEAW